MKQLWTTKVALTKRLIVPVGVVALGAVAAYAAQPVPATQQAASNVAGQSEVKETQSPAPTVTPTIVVNGQVVPVKASGNTEISTGDGKATVSASSGRTVITTTQEPKSGDTSSQKAGNVNVNVSSNNTGGTSWGVVQSFGLNSSSDNLSTSFSNTSVFSTGGDNVSISQ